MALERRNVEIDFKKNTGAPTPELFWDEMEYIYNLLTLFQIYSEGYTVDLAELHRTLGSKCLQGVQQTNASLKNLMPKETHLVITRKQQQLRNVTLNGLSTLVSGKLQW